MDQDLALVGLGSGQDPVLDDFVVADHVAVSSEPGHQRQQGNGATVGEAQSIAPSSGERCESVDAMARADSARLRQ